MIKQFGTKHQMKISIWTDSIRYISYNYPFIIPDPSGKMNIPLTSRDRVKSMMLTWTPWDSTWNVWPITTYSWNLSSVFLTSTFPQWRSRCSNCKASSATASENVTCAKTLLASKILLNCKKSERHDFCYLDFSFMKCNYIDTLTYEITRSIF